MSIHKILFVVNEAGFFLSHRLPLAKAAKDAGYEVHVATPEGPGCEQIREHGLPFHAIPLSRKSAKPATELSTMLALYRLYRQLCPAVIHHVTIKPVLYGGLMARLARAPAVVNAVTGLGFVFSSDDLRTRVMRAGVKQVYRYALNHHNSRVIFQNPDDQELFVSAGLVEKGRAILIRGSGVDMSKFAPTAEPSGTPLVLLAARMLWDKGVAEFVEAARKLRSLKVHARFALVGPIDSGNPSAVPEACLRAWEAEGFVEWWGYRRDMLQVFAMANVICLPSCYREGVPKVLIEAAACGRAAIATDMPGCREIVRHEENGLLVPARDVNALTAAIERLVGDPALRGRFGVRGRQIAEAEFSVGRVVGDTLAIYRQLLQ